MRRPIESDPDFYRPGDALYRQTPPSRLVLEHRLLPEMEKSFQVFGPYAPWVTAGAGLLLLALIAYQCWVDVGRLGAYAIIAMPIITVLLVTAFPFIAAQRARAVAASPLARELDMAPGPAGFWTRTLLMRAVLRIQGGYFRWWIRLVDVAWCCSIVSAVWGPNPMEPLTFAVSWGLVEEFNWFYFLLGTVFDVVAVCVVASPLLYFSSRVAAALVHHAIATPEEGYLETRIEGYMWVLAREAMVSVVALLIVALTLYVLAEPIFGTTWFVAFLISSVCILGLARIEVVLLKHASRRFSDRLGELQVHGVSFWGD